MHKYSQADNGTGLRTRPLLIGIIDGSSSSIVKEIKAFSMDSMNTTATDGLLVEDAVEVQLLGWVVGAVEGLTFG